MVPVVQLLCFWFNFITPEMPHQIRHSAFASSSNQLPAPYFILGPELHTLSEYREHEPSHNGLGSSAKFPVSERCVLAGGEGGE